MAQRTTTELLQRELAESKIERCCDCGRKLPQIEDSHSLYCRGCLLLRAEARFARNEGDEVGRAINTAAILGGMRF